MKQYYKALDKGTNKDVTVGKIYEGEVSMDNIYFRFRDDIGDSSNLYLTRFERATDAEVLAILNKDLSVWETTVAETRKQKLADIEIIKNRSVIKSGQTWRMKGTTHDYIVVTLGFSSYALCSLRDGNRWSSQVDSLEEIFGGQKYKFEQV